MFIIIVFVLTILFYIWAFINIFTDKPVNAKSIGHIVNFGNILALAVIYLLKLQGLPLGGFLEIGIEYALIMSVIYTMFIPIDLKRLSLTIIGTGIVAMTVSTFGGFKLHPHLAVYSSWWLQFSIQAHILAGGILLFCLICLFTVIFDKNKSHAPEIAGFARTGVLAAEMVLVLGILSAMMWNFVVTGEMLLWNKTLLMNLTLATILLLPIVSRQSWFKETRHKYMFDVAVIALVFLVNLAEWGGLV